MSQGSLNVPTTGPVSPTAMAGDMNTAYDALVSKNSGAAAPANFPTSPGAPTTYQEWADTSPGASITDLKVYDGSNWLPTGGMDGVNHVWMPKVGGNTDTIAAAATTDLGSKRSGYIAITGSVPGTPITSFGSNALLTIGETKFLRFSASGILTYNAASMILPGAADLPFNAGDTLQALYLGGGNWLAFDYRTNLTPAGRNTGDVFGQWGTGAISGAVRSLGGTIGNGASGGTERANADTVNLWIFLYIRDTTLTVSGGRTAPGNTRAAAITDYNLNKTLTLPDLTTAFCRKATTYLLSGASNYATPSNATLLEVDQQAGGGGGGGTGSAGTAGNNTTFNGIVATGGPAGAIASTSFSQGGSAPGAGAGAADLRQPGGEGLPGVSNGNSVGGAGGNSAFGGAARPGGGAGRNAGTNTGAGGSGGQNTNNVAGGGAAGERVKHRITSPSGNYAYSVGTGGPGGTGTAGGTGADGFIQVDAYIGPQAYMAL